MISVLYVDDEPGLLELGKQFLERTNEIRVETINSASQGLDQLDLRYYDVIVSDYQMPHMDGIEFLKRIRDTKGNMPFILFTGRGREEVVIEAINNGADFYLQKGGDPRSQFAELAHKIRQLVRRTHAEGMLSQNENLLQTLIRYSDEIITLLNKDGRIVYASPSIAPILGYDADSLTGELQFEYVHPDDRGFVESEFSRAFQMSYGHFPLQYRIRKSDGTYIFVESVITSMLDVPAIQGAIIVTRDVTAWKMREDILRSEIGDLNHAELTNRTGYCTYNPATGMVRLSKGAQGLFGTRVDTCTPGELEKTLIPGSGAAISGILSVQDAGAGPRESELHVAAGQGVGITTLRAVSVPDREKNIVFISVREDRGSR